VDSFEGNHSDVRVPVPILAVNDDDSLVGGLAFSTFAMPNRESIAVWINAVVVAPQARKQGLASQLIQAAEAAAKELQIPALFVLSEYADLYQKQGWRAVGRDESRDSTILTKELANC